MSIVVFLMIYWIVKVHPFDGKWEMCCSHIYNITSLLLAFRKVPISFLLVASMDAFKLPFTSFNLHSHIQDVYTVYSNAARSLRGLGIDFRA